MSSLDDLKDCRDKVAQVRKVLREIDDAKLFAIIDLWMDLNSSNIKHLLELTLRVQKIEDKLRIKNSRPRLMSLSK